MYYKYEFIKHQRFRELYFHFLYFLRKIKNVRKSARFVPANYFHESFISPSGKISPSGVENIGISNAFKAFFDVFKKLDSDKKNEFYDLVVYSNKLKLIFEDNTQTIVTKLHIDYLNNLLQNNIVLKKLMDVLWGNLKTNAWEIDAHYEKFFAKLPDSKMCPFCALRKLIDNELGKEDYDHLLYKAKYPLTSICDSNIAPACSDCNRRFKNVQDILFEDITRRKFKFPYVYNKSYEPQGINLNLDGSIHPEMDLDNFAGNWVINIMPDDDFNRSWSSVYKIKTRYVSYINIDYKKWIREVMIAARINRNNINTITFQDYINNYKKTYEPLDIEYPLKWAYFDYIEKNMSNDLLNYMERIAI